MYSPCLVPQRGTEQDSYFKHWGLHNIIDLDQTDIKHITETRDLIPLGYRSRCEQLVTTQQFKDWLAVPKSRKLLVHGDFTSGVPNHVLALSLLCATLTKVLRTRSRYVSLVFFCGSHIEEDDGPMGGRVIMRSLIAQLTRQHSFDTTFLSQDVNQGPVKAEDLGALWALFSCLVRRLPLGTTLICMIDGISYYENDEHEDDMLRVLRIILSLARARDLAAAVKILATSPSSTDSVQKEFEEDDDCFLSMAEIPQRAAQSEMFNLKSQLDGGSEGSEDYDVKEEEEEED